MTTSIPFGGCTSWFRERSVDLVHARAEARRRVAKRGARCARRAAGVVVGVGLIASCQRPIELRGLYANDITPGGGGVLVACDERKPVFHVRDSALVAAYRREATSPHQPLFVRLRGIRADSGSIYDGQRYLLVSQILELRASTPGECPRASSVFPVSPWARSAEGRAR